MSDADHLPIRHPSRCYNHAPSITDVAKFIIYPSALFVLTSTIVYSSLHKIHTSSSSSPTLLLPPTTTHHRHLRGLPGVAWLLSFPNSGTTYTERLVESLTQRTVATNYGHEHVNADGEPEHITHSVPVFDGGKNGPFRLSDKDIPSGGYILTKTHCGGYCFSDCPPHWYILTSDQYLEECIRGARFEEREDGSSERFWVQYDPVVARRAVHLFRDPYDNIVSRFHHEYKTHNNHHDQAWVTQYPNSPEGFRAWCQDSDSRYKDREPVFFKPEMIKAFEGVPCHGEFYRWVQWHNNAFETTKKLDIPVHVIHYMDYARDLDYTIKGLLNFLELEAVGEARPFTMTGYDDRYYTPEERKRIAEFMKFMASNRTREEMRRYIERRVEGGGGSEEMIKEGADNMAMTTEGGGAVTQQQEKDSTEEMNVNDGSETNNVITESSAMTMQQQQEISESNIQQPIGESTLSSNQAAPVFGSDITQQQQEESTKGMSSESNIQQRPSESASSSYQTPPIFGGDITQQQQQMMPGGEPPKDEEKKSNNDADWVELAGSQGKSSNEENEMTTQQQQQQQQTTNGVFEMPGQQGAVSIHSGPEPLPAESATQTTTQDYQITTQDYQIKPSNLSG